jgi:CheY-like chemotaxis protein
VLTKPIILVAEDVADDALLLGLAFEAAGVNARLDFVSDGNEVIDYLSCAGRFADRKGCPLPVLLLLDLKMPRVGGFDVIKWVRMQPELRRLVIVVLSSSPLLSDVNRAYDLGANSYLEKPLGAKNLLGMIETLDRYWLKYNLHPEIVPLESPKPALV